MGQLVKTKSFYVKNVAKRTSKYGSSVSLVNLKKKKSAPQPVSSSTSSFTSVAKNTSHEGGDQDNANLLSEFNEEEASLEITSDYESYCSSSNLNEIFLEDLSCNQSSDCRRELDRKQRPPKSGPPPLPAHMADEPIRIHPALVCRDSAQRSQLLLKKQGLHFSSVSVESIEHTTRLNTFYNSQLGLNNCHLSQPHVYDQLNYEFEDSADSNAAAAGESSSVNSKSVGLNINYNKNRSPFSSCTSITSNGKLSSRAASSTTHAKCCARNQPKLRRPVSPPPPLFISANGMLAPPPLQLPITARKIGISRPAQLNVQSCSIAIAMNEVEEEDEREQQAQEDLRHLGLGRRRFNELRILFEAKKLSENGSSGHGSGSSSNSSSPSDRDNYDRLNHMLLRVK
jgi:hypothetical protein